MGPPSLFLVPWPFVFGTDEDDVFEFILDDDDAPNLFLDMGAGDDYVLFDNTAVPPGNGKDLLLGGEGNDTIAGTVVVGGSFVAEGGAGDDYFDLDATFFAYGSAAVKGGSGDDVIDILLDLVGPLPDSTGGPGPAGHLVVDAGDGDDEVHLKYDLQNVTVSSFAFHGTAEVDLGAGNDGLYFVVDVQHQIDDDPAPIPIDTFSLNFTKIEAGAGDDCVIFDIVGTGPAGSGRVDLGPLQLSTGDGNDEVAVGASGEYIDSIGMMNGNINTGAGDDSVMLNDVVLHNSRVDLGEGNDSLYWNFILTGENEVPPISSGNGSQIYAEQFAWIDAGAGDDEIEINATFTLPEIDDEVLVASNNAYISWYHAGMRVDGGGGNDNINVGLLIVAEDVEGEAGGPPHGWLQTDGGTGNDTIYIAFGFESISVEADYDAGSARGGDGNDVLLVFSEASDDLGIEDAFHVRGDAGMDTFVVSKGQETVVIDDFILGEDDLFLNGIFSEDEWDATLISKLGPASTGILDIDGNLIAVLQGIAPEDLGAGDVQYGVYV